MRGRRNRGNSAGFFPVVPVHVVRRLHEGDAWIDIAGGREVVSRQEIRPRVRHRTTSSWRSAPGCSRVSMPHTARSH